jgi:tetratricopeptide (TPR) repeat protein
VAEQGLGLYPEDLYFGLYYQIGLSAQGRPEEALAATRQYLARHPQEPNAWDELGIRFLNLALPDSAEFAFNNALELDPNFLPSQRGLSYCAYSRGNIDAAIAINLDILQREDLMPGHRLQLLFVDGFWPGLAFYYAEAGRYQQALATFSEALTYAADPVSQIRVETARSRLWLTMGNPAAVLAWADSLPARQVELAPLVSIQYRARALVALDSLAAARTAVDQLHATEDRWGGVARSEALKVKALIALAEAEPRLALENLREAAKHGIPDGGFFDLEYREIQAQAHRQAGRLEKAAGILLDLLEIYGSHALAYYQLGQIYEEMDQADQAQWAYRSFLAAWSGADKGLPQVAEAQQRLARLAGS